MGQVAARLAAQTEWKDVMKKSSNEEVIRQRVREQLKALNVPFVDDLTEAYFSHGPSALAQAVFIHAAWQEVIEPNNSS
jgi:hypothetical protein